MLVLALLMVFFSLLEGMAFRETGLREGHGELHLGRQFQLLCAVGRHGGHFPPGVRFRSEGQDSVLRTEGRLCRRLCADGLARGFGRVLPVFPAEHGKRFLIVPSRNE